MCNFFGKGNTGIGRTDGLILLNKGVEIAPPCCKSQVPDYVGLDFMAGWWEITNIKYERIVALVLLDEI